MEKMHRTRYVGRSTEILWSCPAGHPRITSMCSPTQKLAHCLTPDCKRTFFKKTGWYLLKVFKKIAFNWETFFHFYFYVFFLCLTVCFSYIYWSCEMVFLLVNVGNYIIWFSKLYQLCLSGLKSNLNIFTYIYIH